MRSQRQIKVPFLPVCICNSLPRAYATLADASKPESESTYHVECHPCHIVTPKFHSKLAAVACFRAMIASVTLDRSTHKTKGVQRA